LDSGWLAILKARAWQLLGLSLALCGFWLMGPFFPLAIFLLVFLLVIFFLIFLVPAALLNWGILVGFAKSAGYSLEYSRPSFVSLCGAGFGLLLFIVLMSILSGLDWLFEFGGPGYVFEYLALTSWSMANLIIIRFFLIEGELVSWRFALLSALACAPLPAAVPIALLGALAGW